MKSKTRVIQVALAAAFVVAAGVPAAHAQLQRVGPVDPKIGGYPAWYQDKTGLTLEFCTPTTQSELNGGWCTILPADVPNGSVPEVPFTNYSEEHFYWIASAGVRTAGQLVLALEGAFAVGPAIAGDQIVFGRLRITHTNLPAGLYKVFTPFGDFTFDHPGGRLFFTSDIGINGGGFEAALNSAIGPFLLPSATAGGAEMPPVTATNTTPDTDPAHFGGVFAPTAYPGTGKSYIADPARIGPVTGSPLAPFVGSDGVTYNHNVFRIEGPGGVVTHEENFSLGGRVMTATIPAQVRVNRASYSASAAGNKLDVFATAAAAVAGRVPASGLLPGLNPPDLGFYDAPCATDTTGAVIGPPAPPAGGAPLQYYQMFNDGAGKWWGGNAPLAIPPQVCVQDLNARDAAGNVKPTYFLGDVTDEIHINWATVMWDPTVNGGTLTVSAASSDELNGPVLTLQGYTVPATDPLTGATIQVSAVLTGGSVTISPLSAPADKVTVVSTRGGRATLDTTTGVGVPVNATVPVANADSLTTPEDAPVANINVLANDTLGGAPITPASATVAISAQGRLGTATLNPDNTITYTPNLNANGTDIVGYKVTVNGVLSPEGYLTVIITPVNDPPVAFDDRGGAPNNRAVTINVLGNDNDPDGAADLAAAAIVTLPAAGATLTCNGGTAVVVGTLCAGGTITFTPTIQGSFTFTYKAQDQAGAQSALAATVTMTVNATESIVVTKSQYVVSKNRWVVTGTDSVIAGQTLAIAYTSGTYKVNGACTGNATGVVVGTANVDALGAWSFDAILTSAGVLNPSNTGGNSTGFWCTPPKQISITSALGGTATTNITLK